MSEISPEPSTVLAFRIPDRLRAKAEELARAKHFQSISEYARDLVRRDVEEHEDSNPQPAEATAP